MGRVDCRIWVIQGGPQNVSINLKIVLIVLIFGSYLIGRFHDLRASIAILSLDRQERSKTISKSSNCV